LMAVAVMVSIPVAAQQTQLKMATLAPEGSPWMEAAHTAADEIAERTSGRVAFRFYPGGTMGSDQAILRKMRIGQLHGGALLAGSLSTVDPNAEIYNLPLLFHSYDEVDAVRSRFDQKLIQRLENEGLVVLGFVETGFVYLMSSKPTASFDELEGRKIWVPEGDEISKAITDASGLSPVALSVADVMTGLQTGLIDTVAAPPVAAVALQWFTRAKYVTDLPITYVYGAVVLSSKAFDRLSADDRNTVREVMGRALSELDSQARSDNAEATAALEKQGVQMVTPTAATVERWYGMAAEATQSLIKKQGYDPALLDGIREVLEAYRSKQGAERSGR
jgi:TRAP-type C4-dicarboxylate transport system substrate-binding protein